MDEAIHGLLNRKIQEATASMQSHLDTQLWGKRPDSIVVSPAEFEGLERVLKPQARYMSQPLADRGFENLLFKGIPIIKEPSMNEVNAVMKDAYISGIKENIYRESPIVTHLEGNMNLATSIRAELDRKKEVKRVTKQLRKFEGSWITKLRKGAVIGFKVPKNVTIIERYSVATKARKDTWLLAGSSHIYSTNELIDLMIDRGVDFKRVELLR